MHGTAPEYKVHINKKKHGEHDWLGPHQVPGKAFWLGFFLIVWMVWYLFW